jgi:hypothetical protein
MNEVEKIRQKVAAVRPVIAEFAIPELRERIEMHKASLLSGSDINAMQGYLEMATDEECVCVLSLCSLQAPLDDDHYRIYMSLFARIFIDLGVDVPEDIRQTGAGELSSWHKSILNSLKRKIRKKGGRK